MAEMMKSEGGVGGSSSAAAGMGDWQTSGVGTLWTTTVFMKCRQVNSNTVSGRRVSFVGI